MYVEVTNFVNYFVYRKTKHYIQFTIFGSLTQYKYKCFIDDHKLTYIHILFFTLEKKFQKKNNKMDMKNKRKLGKKVKCKKL